MAIACQSQRSTSPRLKRSRRTSDRCTLTKKRELLGEVPESEVPYLATCDHIRLRKVQSKNRLSRKVRFDCFEWNEISSGVRGWGGGRCNFFFARALGHTRQGAVRAQRETDPQATARSERATRHSDRRTQPELTDYRSNTELLVEKKVRGSVATHEGPRYQSGSSVASMEDSVSP